MRALRTAALSAALAVVALAPAAHAESVTHYGQPSGFAAVAGTLTWYNRSVGVSGTVANGDPNACVYVRFDFFISATLYKESWSPASPYPVCNAAQFNHVQRGPVGGWRRVDVCLFHPGQDSGCSTYLRSDATPAVLDDAPDTPDVTVGH